MIDASRRTQISHKSPSSYFDSFKTKFFFDVRSPLKEISGLDEKKRGTFKNIPVKCLKETSVECGPYLARIWNEEVVVGLNKFPKDLKLADVTPIFQKDNATQIKKLSPC